MGGRNGCRKGFSPCGDVTRSGGASLRRAMGRCDTGEKLAGYVYSAVYVIYIPSHVNTVPAAGPFRTAAGSAAAAGTGAAGMSASTAASRSPSLASSRTTAASDAEPATSRVYDILPGLPVLSYSRSSTANRAGGGPDAAVPGAAPSIPGGRKP